MRKPAAGWAPELSARLLTALLAGLVCSGSVWAQIAPTDDLARLLAWLGGEWNNNEQVWQQKLDLNDPKVLAKPALSEHLHQVLTPVALPQLGSHVFYVQQAAVAAPGAPAAAVSRQALWRFVSEAGSGGSGAIRAERFELQDPTRLVDLHKNPERLAALKAADWRAVPGCDVLWRYQADVQSFEGRSTPGGCHITAASGARVQTDTQMQLSAQQLLSTEQTRDAGSNGITTNITTTNIRQRKVRYFEGWFWIKVAGPTATADDKKTSFKSKLLLHTEGQRMAVTYEDGTPSPYLLELALLTYQNTKKPILKFALLDSTTLKSVTYIWANPDASLIGMNLNWFQAGFTQKAERINYGF